MPDDEIRLEGPGIGIEVPGIGHKKDCIWENETTISHRVPIGCVTIQDLLDRVSSLETEIKAKARLITELKAKIYDFQNEDY